MSWSMGANGAFAFGGHVAGIAKVVKTDAYIDAALTYSHSILVQAFDAWIDGIARMNPEPLAHVYEWPTEFQDYSETVGNPAFRLWRHTLTGGRGRNKVASYEFLPSTRPSPVDPILLEPGPSGHSVKEGVHIFVWKAQAMEYAIDITVTPELADYLAYVGNRAGQGEDEGWHHAKQNPDSGNIVNFSEGPVSFKAGGEVHYLQFSKQFIYWWATMAGGEFDAKVAPRLQKDLVSQAKLSAAIRRGNRKAAKSLKMTASPAAGARDWEEAEAIAIKDLEQKQGNYIREAAVRRAAKYGD